MRRKICPGDRDQFPCPYIHLHIPLRIKVRLAMDLYLPQRSSICLKSLRSRASARHPPPCGQTDPWDSTGSLGTPRGPRNPKSPRGRKMTAIYNARFPGRLHGHHHCVRTCLVSQVLNTPGAQCILYRISHSFDDESRFTGDYMDVSFVYDLQ